MAESAQNNPQPSIGMAKPLLQIRADVRCNAPAKPETRSAPPHHQIRTWRVVSDAESWPVKLRAKAMNHTTPPSAAHTKKVRTFRVVADVEECVIRVKRPNVEVWHRLLEARPRNWVEGCNRKGHFDSGRVAGCPPPSCSAWVRSVR